MKLRGRGGAAFPFARFHADLTASPPRWPKATDRLATLQLEIAFRTRSLVLRQVAPIQHLTLEIIDYPGEWLLDLPLLNKTYEQWSRESLALSRERPRARLAAQWHAQLATLNASAHEDEQAALAGARLFTDYLRACRDERFAMSLLPPGRFLMPGNLAGSPALTFTPLDLPSEGVAPEGSLWAMMARRSRTTVLHLMLAVAPTIAVMGMAPALKPESFERRSGRAIAAPALRRADFDERRH